MFGPFTRFCGKIWVGFCRNTGKRFFLRRFILKPAERAQVLLKNGTGNFQNSPPFERLASFYGVISRNFEHFQYFKFEIGFLENENFLKKTGVPFLIESTNIKNVSYPKKTAISEANVKTNRMVSTKQTYHKNGLLPVTTTLFF